MNRKEQIADLFWKFGLLGVKELQDIYGATPTRRQLNRYLWELTQEERIERRCHPNRYIFAYEATPKILHEKSKKRFTTFQRQNSQQISHRLEVTTALVNLCKRSKVIGVAIEHEFTKEDLKEFCIGRVPDGSVVVEGLADRPVELAVEVECSGKTRSRMKAILDGYRRTIENPRYRCKGVLLFATDENVLNQYQNLLAGYPEKFQNAVFIARGTSTLDIEEHVLGRVLGNALENPNNPCLSRRTTSHGETVFLQ